MTGRTLHVVETIRAVVDLLRYSTCRDVVGDELIIKRGEKALCVIWSVEWRSMAKMQQHHRQLSTKYFWTEVHTIMETKQMVSKFLALFGETVNPPGQQGNVEVCVTPHGSLEQIIFKLKPQTTL